MTRSRPSAQRGQLISRLATLGAAVLLAGACSAQAADITRRGPPAPVFVEPQPVGGFYFATRTGISFIDDTSFDLGGGGLRVNTEYETGARSSFALGYNFGPVFGPAMSARVEIEGGYGDFSVDRHRINGLTVASIDSFGGLTALSGFASAFLDFNLGGGYGILSTMKPFIGAGIGAANVELKKQGVSATGVVMDDEDSGVAYHLSAGVGVDLAALGLGSRLFSRSTFEVGYRFMHASNLEFTARDGTRSKTDFSADMVTVGFRRQF